MRDEHPLTISPSRASADGAPVGACRLCGSTDIAPFLTVSDNGHLRSEDIQLSVWCCCACDICFLNPFPPAELGAKYFALSYASPPKSMYYDDAFKVRVSQTRLEALQRRGPQGRRLLDVGCGKGQFVGVALREGWDAWGVEFDAGAVATAHEAGISTVFEGSIEHSALPLTFDVITLWDVIEHLQDPKAVLRQAYDRLAAGGLLAVRTGNIRSYRFAKNPAKWWAFGVDHRFYFSPRSLANALVATGFTIVDVLNLEPLERPDKAPGRLRDDPRHLVRHLLGQLRHGAHYWTSLMTVVARKPAN